MNKFVHSVVAAYAKKHSTKLPSTKTSMLAVLRCELHYAARSLLKIVIGILITLCLHYLISMVKGDKTASTFGSIFTDNQNN